MPSQIHTSVVNVFPYPIWGMEIAVIDLAGQRFGRLLVLNRMPGGIWMCECDCGRTSYVVTGNLRKGNSRSCGCLWKEKITTHGMGDTPEYKVWRGMRSRCGSRSDISWKNYGGRGIYVCKEWDDFATFLKDMGKRPSPLFDLDRIDNNKGYSKENCRWVTRTANLNNRRNNCNVEYHGRTQTIAVWARELGFAETTLRNRLKRGWPVERAFTEKV